MSQEFGSEGPEVSSTSAVDSVMESRESAAPQTDADGEVVSSGYAAPAQAPQAAQQQQYQWQGVVDYAKQQGVHLPYTDDVAALQALLNAHRQGQERNFYADLGRSIAPYADQVRAFIQQNQLQRDQQQQPQQDPDAAPPWDPRWLHLVERDPQTGLLRTKPGYDPAIADKVQAYADWKDKWDAPDRKMQEAYVDRRAEQKAREIVQREFATHRQSLQAENLVGQNSGWLFQANQDGSPVYDGYGARVMSPAGQLYARAVKNLWDSGVQDVDRCHQMARTVVENAVLRQHYITSQQQQYQQPQPAVAAQQYGQVAPSVGGNVGRPAQGQRGTPRSNKGLSLRELVNARMQGLSDEDATG